MSEATELNHHKLISFAIGLLFLIVLQAYASPQPVFRFLIPAFLLYLGMVALYDRWYLKKIGKYNFWVFFRPLLMLVSAFGLFFIIPSLGLRVLFLIVSVGLISFFQSILGNTSQNLLLNETLIVAFGMFLALCAADFYAPDFGPLYLAAVFFSTSLLARSFYQPLTQAEKIKGLGALVIGLFCAELYWVLNFLQFHFSVLAVLLFDVFYFCLILNYYHLYHLLNFKKIQFHLMLILACTAIVLISTPWNMVTG